MATGFITGLLGGLDKNRQEEQFKLTERKARGQEIDLVQREARRVSDLDAQDEQQTMTQLMNPGLHPDSRNAIVSSRNARRQQNQSFIQSLQGDPDKAGDIKARYGDLSQMLAPSSIGTGNLPKPTIDLPTILSFLDKENTRIRGMGTEENKRAELARARGVATDVYGASPDVVNRVLPEYGSETSRTPGKVSDWQKIDNIQGLDPSLKQGGKLKQNSGVTLETEMQDGQLMKRYQNPDLSTTETYQQPEKEMLNMQKLRLDIPFLKARIDQVNAKTAAIPKEIDIKYKGLMDKIADRNVKNNLRQMAIGVSQEANQIRMWGLKKTHERGMLGIGIRGGQLDLGQQRLAESQKQSYIKRLDKLAGQLDFHIGKAAIGTQKGMPQVVKAEVDMATALKKQIEAAKMYVTNSENPDYNESFINSELDEGGYSQRPSQRLGLPEGNTTYNAGGYGQMSPQDMAAYMQRGMGYNTDALSPLYNGGVFAGGRGGVPQGNAATQTPVSGSQPKTVKMSPSGFGFQTPAKNTQKLRSTGQGASGRISDYVTQKK